MNLPINLPNETYREIYKNLFPLDDCIEEAKGRMTIPNFGFRNELDYEYYDHHYVLDRLYYEFSDICSPGDVLINKMLDAIATCDWRTLHKLKTEYPDLYEVILTCWNRWVEDGEPVAHPFG